MPISVFYSWHICRLIICKWFSRALCFVYMFELMWLFSFCHLAAYEDTVQFYRKRLWEMQQWYCKGCRQPMEDNSSWRPNQAWKIIYASLWNWNSLLCTVRFTYLGITQKPKEKLTKRKGEREREREPLPFSMWRFRRHSDIYRCYSISPQILKKTRGWIESEKIHRKTYHSDCKLSTGFSGGFVWNGLCCLSSSISAIMQVWLHLLELDTTAACSETSGDSAKCEPCLG